MCESYSRWLLHMSVAQVCQVLGWDSVQLSTCDLLTNMLQRYLHSSGHGCQRYCELWILNSFDNRHHVCNRRCFCLRRPDQKGVRIKLVLGVQLTRCSEDNAADSWKQVQDAQVFHGLQSGAKNQVHKRLCRVQRCPQRLRRASGVQFKPFSPSNHLLASPFALAEQQRSISCYSLSSSSGSFAEFPTACFPITHHIWDEGMQQPHMEITCGGEFSLTISALEPNSAENCVKGGPKQSIPCPFHMGI